MIKSLVIRLFSAFSDPFIERQTTKVKYEEEQKAWRIELSSRNLTQKIEEAKKVQAEVRKFCDDICAKQMANYVKQPIPPRLPFFGDTLGNGWKIK